VGLRMDKAYHFDTGRGQRLAGRPGFGGRSQLLVYHLMFGPDYAAACPSARRSRMVSTASTCTSPITTSWLWACRGRAAREAAGVPRRGGAGHSPGRLRMGGDFKPRLQRPFHRRTAARRRHRIQLPSRAAAAVARLMRGRRAVRRPRRAAAMAGSDPPHLLASGRA